MLQRKIKYAEKVSSLFSDICDNFTTLLTWKILELPLI